MRVCVLCQDSGIENVARQIAEEINQDAFTGEPTRQNPNRDPPPENWHDAKLFKLNPACTQRITLLSLKVDIGHGGFDIKDTSLMPEHGIRFIKIHTETWTVKATNTRFTIHGL